MEEARLVPDRKNLTGFPGQAAVVDAMATPAVGVPVQAGNGSMLNCILARYEVLVSVAVVAAVDEYQGLQKEVALERYTVL